MKICKILLVLCLCFFALPTLGAEVNITVDKKVITDGDTVRLTVEYNGDDGQKPDISPLQQDFYIVSRGSSNYVNFINGQLSQLQKWTFDLKPRKVGKITIKPINVGNISSNYAEVEVKELTDVAYVPDSEENTNSPYFQIEQSHFPAEPYVQQQLTILVTVYDSIGLQNGNIHLSEASQKDWAVIPLLNKPIVKQDVINNRKMNVVTFALAAFPQKSGTLALPEISFEGYYIRNNDIDLSAFDDFMNFGFNIQNLMGQQVPVRMKTLKESITVKPIPDGFTGKNWLPLKKLELSAEFPHNATFKIGDAISRKLNVTAVGIRQNMLPQISFNASDAFKQYPEKPETKEQVINGDVVTTAQINTVYIPVKTGKQLLPPLDVEWFNVETGHFEKTSIPSEEIFIYPNADIQSETLSPQIAENDTQQPSPSPTEKKITPPVQQKIEMSYLKYFRVIAISILILLFAVLLLTRKPKNPYYKLVIKSLKKRDYKEVRTFLIEWAKIKFNRMDITNFNMIANFANNKDFSEQLSALNKFLYSETDDVFNSAKFIEIFKRVDKIKYKEQKIKKILPNLYD